MADIKFEQVFDQMGAKTYDDNNKPLEAINTNLHFLMSLILQDLKKDAHILCVGVGTGADIIHLASIFPQWTFTGIDPSQAMLDGCREKLEKLGLSDRCRLFKGYLSDYQTEETFDATLCLFVMHFVHDRSERQKMYQDMRGLLNPGGYLIDTEISADLTSDRFPKMLKDWQSMHRHTGGSEENLAQMGKTLKDVLAVMAPTEVEAMIEASGFDKPVPFFQSLLIRGWHARKFT